MSTVTAHFPCRNKWVLRAVVRRQRSQDPKIIAEASNKTRAPIKGKRSVPGERVKNGHKKNRYKKQVRKVIVVGNQFKIVKRNENENTHLPHPAISTLKQMSSQCRENYILKFITLLQRIWIRRRNASN